MADHEEYGILMVGLTLQVTKLIKVAAAQILRHEKLSRRRDAFGWPINRAESGGRNTSYVIHQFD